MKNLTLILSVLVIAGSAVGQGKNLERAILIEEQEHDTKQAAKLYGEIARDAKTPATDRTLARYRLGRVLLQLGRTEEGMQALAAAAKGTGPSAAAAKALLASGGQDPERERELRARAKEVLAGIGDIADQLRWIGPAAVPEIVARWDAQWRVGSSTDSDKHRQINLVWQIGGKHARAFLTGALDSGNANYKSTLAWGVPGDLDPKLLDLALRFMDDESLDADARIRVALSTAGRAPLERILRLTRSEATRVAAHAWKVVAMVLNSASQGQGEAGVRVRFQAVLPALRQAVARRDNTVASAADAFLARWGSYSEDGFELLLARLPQWPRNASVQAPVTSVAPRPGLFLQAVQSLGPLDPVDSRTAFVERQLNQALVKWGIDALPAVLTLIRSGYLENSSSQWFHEHKVFDDEKLGGQVVATLGSSAQLMGLFRRSAFRRLPRSAFPVLKRCWAERREPHRVDLLFASMVATGAAELVPFLLARFDDAATRDAASDAFRHLVRRMNEPEIAAVQKQAGIYDALRRILPQVNPARGGSYIIALLEAGDEKVIPMLPALFRSKIFTNLGMLADHPSQGPEGTVWIPIHGYDPQRLATIWAFLLDQGPEFWTQNLLNRSGGFASGYRQTLSSSSQARKELVQVLLPRLRIAMAAAEAADQPLAEHPQRFLIHVLDLPRTWQNPDAPTLAEAQQLTTACLSSKLSDLRRTALSVLLHRKPTAEQRQMILALLGAEDRETAQAAIHVLRAQIVLTATELQALVAAGESPARTSLFVDSYFRGWPGKIRTATLLVALDDSDDVVRQQVCHLLGRQCDAAAVPALLKRLKDPSPQVRTAAQAALRSIRFYHEQKAHWNRVFEGPGVTTNNAAEDLLKQAAPKESKQVRLLALRSLGLLGKVETVPFLIRFSKEADAEIRTAALAAIAEVHRRAALEKR